MPERQRDKTLWAYKTKVFILLFLDVLSIIFSYFIGLWARYDFRLNIIPDAYKTSCCYLVTAIMVFTVITYYAFRLYHSVWRYASISEAYRVVYAYIVIGIFALLLNLIPALQIPRSALLLGYILSFMFCVVFRFGYRMLRYKLNTRIDKEHGRERVLIIGAGQAAQEIIKDIRTGHSKEYDIIGLIDDNKLKLKRFLEGIQVLGNRNDIPTIVQNEEVDRIIFAINNIEPSDKADILNICKETGCKLVAVPGLNQLYTGEVRVSRLRNVEIDDLLGRSEIKVNNDEILKSLMGKRVMVTGGGGSIGSELCRQIAKANPALLIIFDIYENTTYDIQQELKRNCPNLNLITLIGDVTDRKRMRSVLQRYKPDIIYHAAAHKHVPLMEDSPNEAIKNNVMGTLCVCEEAAEVGVKKFLLISTDKAVNPTNIMGASKRLCEMIIQMMNRRDNGTQYMAVRFGNVLGSNGSVIPLFKKQIAAGGPVTVTDPNIIRYFMTIQEAVSLVLQAGYYAKGGEIFVLDMGKPVKIDDMARNLIKLSGLKPDVDIEIKYTGLRPGEKLYEELLMDEEGMTKTENDLIYIGHPLEMNDSVFMNELRKLDVACHEESIHIESLVETIVPTYSRFHTENTDEFTKQLEVIVNDQMIAKETKERLVKNA